ncbi:MAG: hypothetical protein RLZZ597_3130 [Cyanobacteriota bacterium]
MWHTNMITLTTDEVVLLKSILTALRGIKVRDIDRALVVLSKNDIDRASAQGPIDDSGEV